MRRFVCINHNWNFIGPDGKSQNVNIPHTWNAIDGQDGGNDYHRGTCYYAKAFAKNSLPVADEYYVEINGANSSADLYLNV